MYLCIVVARKMLLWVQEKAIGPKCTSDAWVREEINVGESEQKWKTKTYEYKELGIEQTWMECTSW